MPHKQVQADTWIAAALKAGWRVRYCSPASHTYARLFPADREYAPISLMGTPTSRRRRNERARLRRAGLNV